MSAHIFVVDDDRAELAAIETVLKKRGYCCSCFTRGRECLCRLSEGEPCDILITDVKMPGMDGLKLLGRVRELRPGMPVIVTTGHDKVQYAVEAMRQGAVNFLEKPFEAEELSVSIESALNGDDGEALYPPPCLTDQERRVLRLVLQGKANKYIAREMNRSVRTIEDHRSHIMRKLRADNTVMLVQRAIELGLA